MAFMNCIRCYSSIALLIFDLFLMAFAFVIIGAVLIWTAGRADWIVAYATGVAQLGVWLTLAGLVPVSALWQRLKRQPFVDQPTNQARAHWSVSVKVS